MDKNKQRISKKKEWSFGLKNYSNKISFGQVKVGNIG